MNTVAHRPHKILGLLTNLSGIRTAVGPVTYRAPPLLLAAVLAIGLASGPALADKPSWAGEKGGKGHSDRQRDRDPEARQDQGRPVSQDRHFRDQHRVAVRDYYATQFQTGSCPPGLAKKKNGCMPPGQAKKWKVGQPLPRDVVYYEVPHSLVVTIGVPPPGYRYVRVASDILMIAIGTAMVMDAIQDLGR